MILYCLNLDPQKAAAGGGQQVIKSSCLKPPGDKSHLEKKPPGEKTTWRKIYLDKKASWRKTGWEKQVSENQLKTMEENQVAESQHQYQHQKIYWRGEDGSEGRFYSTKQRLANFHSAWDFKTISWQPDSFGKPIQFGTG